MTSAVLAWLLWRLVLRPVWALTAHARAMKSAQGDVPVPRRFGTAEISDLGQSVIEMGQALQARARSLTAYADHVTHELKSPLTSLRGAADLLHDDSLDRVDRAALLNTIEQSTTRMETLLNDLRVHAAARIEAAPGTCRALDAVGDVDAGIEIRLVQDGDVPMRQGDLARVLTQMAGNARDSGATHLCVEVTPNGLRISDDGPGIEAGDRARIFDPFFTTRRPDGGTGMGLTISRTLVEAAGGAIDLSDEPGAVFLITF